METKSLQTSVTLLAGFQWLFFMFANTVVIPISVGSAFQLESIEIVSAIQRSFIFTGAACLLQGLIGHRLALMEGQSGLWWGVILSLAATASTMNLELTTIGGSIAVGVIISGILVAVFGILGYGGSVKKVVYTYRNVCFSSVTSQSAHYYFLKGMIGLNTSDSIDVKVACFSFTLAALTILIHVKGKGIISSLNLLIGMTVGWIGAALYFQWRQQRQLKQPLSLLGFLGGNPTFEWGIVITVVITGLLNTTNTIATLKGAEDIFEKETTPKQYRSSFFSNRIVVNCLQACLDSFLMHRMLHH